MDTLILLSDECSELAAKLRRASELGADITVAELQREASNLAGSLLLFSGADVDRALVDVIHSLIVSLQRSKAHGESCERKIAEFMDTLWKAGTQYGEMLLQLEKANRELEQCKTALKRAVL